MAVPSERLYLPGFRHASGLIEAVPSAPAASVDLLAALRLLWRRKLLLTAFAVAGTVLLVALSLVISPTYKGQAQVAVDPRQPKVMPQAPVMPSIDDLPEAVLSEVDIIQSNEALNYAFDAVGLANYREYNHDLPPDPTWADNFQHELWLHMRDLKRWLRPPPPPGLDEDRGDMLTQMDKALTVEPDGKSRVITITFSARDPRLAALVPNALVDFYLRQQQIQKASETQDGIRWLNEQLPELRRRAAEADDAVEHYRSEAGMTNVATTTLLTQQLTDLTLQLTQAKVAQEGAQARLRQVEQLIEQPDGLESSTEVLNNPALLVIRTQLMTVITKEADARTRLGRRHPSLIAVEAERTRLEGELRQKMREVAASLRNEAMSATAKANALESQLSALQARVDRQGMSSVKLRSLDADAQATRQVFDSALARLKEMIHGAGLERADARTISLATVPVDPSFPKPFLVALAGFVLSAGAGAVFIFLSEQARTTVRSADQVQDCLGLSTLSMLPNLRSVRSPFRPEREVLERPQSIYSEAVQTLLVRLSQADNSSMQSVVVTSAVPGEGKTAVGLAMARAAQKTGKRVILLDGDLRRGRVHTALKLPRGPGLADYLGNGAAIGEIIHTDGASGVDVITAGRSRFSPTALLAPGRLRALFEQLETHYDLIIVDAPPVLSVADVLLIGKLVRSAILVVKWDGVRQSVLRNALGRLGEADISLAGAVLNNVDVRAHAKCDYSDSVIYRRPYLTYYKREGREL